MSLGFSHLALAGALAACLSGIGGFAYGIRVGVTQEQAARKRADEAAAAERERLQHRIDAADLDRQATEYTRQANVREITHESQTIIDRPVYRNVCIDADGVGLLDSAAAIANGESLGEPVGPSAQAAEGAAQ